MDKPNKEATPGNPSHTLWNASLGSLVDDLNKMTEKKRVEVQLHWSEYIKGEWSTRESSGYAGAEEDKMILSVSSGFKQESVRIYVYKHDGEEDGVYVNLYSDSSIDRIHHSFYLAGRNSIPKTYKKIRTFPVDLPSNYQVLRCFLQEKTF